MSLQIGTAFTIEIGRQSLFVRIGRFERFWNTMGLPSH